MRVVFIVVLITLMGIPVAKPRVSLTYKIRGQDSRVYTYGNMIYEENWRYFEVINHQLTQIPANNGLDQAKDIWKGITSDVLNIKAICYLKYADIQIQRKDGRVWKMRLPRLNLTTYAKQTPMVIDLEVKTNQHCILMFSDGHYAVSIANFN